MTYIRSPVSHYAIFPEATHCVSRRDVYDRQERVFSHVYMWHTSYSPCLDWVISLVSKRKKVRQLVKNQTTLQSKYGTLDTFIVAFYASLIL